MSKIIRRLYLLLFLLTPLIYTSFNSELFELPKMYFIYSMAVLIGTAHLTNWVNGKVPLHRKTFLDLPLFLFLISQTISTILSIDPHTSIFGYYSRMNGGLLSLLCYAALYWILVIYIDENFKNKIILSSLVSGFLVSSFGILQHFGIDKSTWVQDVQSRVFASLGQPNWLAAYLCILIPFSLYKSLSSKSSFRFTYYLLLVTFYTCLLFTKSQSGIYASLTSIGVFFIIYFLKNRSQFLRITFYLLLFTILSLSINNPLKDKFFPVPAKIQDLRSDILITPSQDIRKIVWQGAINLWKKYPVLGTGVETFAHSYYWTRPTSHNLTSEWEFLYNKAHNEYLNYLATTGTVGFLAYIFVIISIIYHFLKSPLLVKGGVGGGFVPAILASFVSILITNAAGFSVAIVAIYFFLLPALSLPITDYRLPITKRSKIFYIPILLVSFFLVSRIFSYYLADITFAQADSADNRNDYQTASDYLNSSLYYRPNEPTYLSRLSNIEAKLAIVKKSDYYLKIAIAHSLQALDTSPVNINFLKEQAQMYYYLASIDKQYFPKAIDSLYQVTQLAPTDAKTFYLIANFLHSAQADNEALPYLLKAIQLKPNYDHAYFMAGQIYFNEKKFIEAKTMFDLALKYAPTNTEAQSYLNKIEKIKSKI